MKKILNIALTIISLQAFGQVDYDTIFVQSSCATARTICSNSQVMEIPFSDQKSCESYLGPQYFRFRIVGTSSFIMNSYGHTGNYAFFGPLNSSGIADCEQIALGQVGQVTGSLSGSISTTLDSGSYILRIQPTNCINIGGGIWGMKLHLASEHISCRESDKNNCADCIGSFSPDPGQYIVSAWVKGESQNKNASYENPELVVSFIGSPDSYSFAPSGKVIDDWQRIDGIVTVPPTATDIQIALHCQAGTCFFDDIRFVPIKGSMVSYVYDPVTLRLVAQLDERNYATLYEYDEEGKLIRVKKETERGIMTIQENRDNIHKR